MKIGIKHSIKIKDILLYTVAFLIVYESGSLPSIISIRDSFYDKALLFLFLGVFALFALCYRKAINNIVGWCAIFIFFICINSLVYIETTDKLIYRLLIFLLIYLLLFYTDIKKIDFDKYICDTILLIAVISLIIYVLVHLLSIPIPYSYFYLGASKLRYISYGGLYFEQGYPNIQFGLELYRMTGPFWEPGVFQIFLNYALYRYMIIDKGKKVAILILLVDLFLTMSASGWICAVAIFIFKMATSKNVPPNTKIVISFLLFIVGMIVIRIILYNKFSETYSNGSSAYIRINDFLLALELFVENPLFGTGFSNVEPFEIRNKFNLTGTLGSSNGLMTICYTTGIFGLVFVTYPFVSRIFKIKKEEKYKYIFYFLIILFFNFVEPVYYFPFMLYVLAKEYRLLIGQKHPINNIKIGKVLSNVKGEVYNEKNSIHSS